MAIQQWSLVSVDSRYLKRYMLRKSFTPFLLAEKADVSERTIYRMLKGSRVRMETLYKVARALDIPPDFLVSKEVIGRD